MPVLHFGDFSVLKDQAGALQHDPARLQWSDVVVDIEHCVNCKDHRQHTYHDEEKYSEFGRKVSDSVRLEFPELEVRINAGPSTCCFSVRQPYPRIGACEVSLVRRDSASSHPKLRNLPILLWSKLRHGKWPVAQSILQQLRDFQDGVQLPRSQPQVQSPEASTPRARPKSAHLVAGVDPFAKKKSNWQRAPTTISEARQVDIEEMQRRQCPSPPSGSPGYQRPQSASAKCWSPTAPKKRFPRLRDDELQELFGRLAEPKDVNAGARTWSFTPANSLGRPRDLEIQLGLLAHTQKEKFDFSKAGHPHCQVCVEAREETSQRRRRLSSGGRPASAHSYSKEGLVPVPKAIGVCDRCQKTYCYSCSNRICPVRQAELNSLPLQHRVDQLFLQDQLTDLQYKILSRSSVDWVRRLHPDGTKRVRRLHPDGTKHAAKDSDSDSESKSKDSDSDSNNPFCRLVGGSRSTHEPRPDALSGRRKSSKGRRTSDYSRTSPGGLKAGEDPWRHDWDDPKKTKRKTVKERHLPHGATWAGKSASGTNPEKAQNTMRLESVGSDDEPPTPAELRSKVFERLTQPRQQKELNPLPYCPLVNPQTDLADVEGALLMHNCATKLGVASCRTNEYPCATCGVASPANSLCLTCHQIICAACCVGGACDSAAKEWQSLLTVEKCYILKAVGLMSDHEYKVRVRCDQLVFDRLSNKASLQRNKKNNGETMLHNGRSPRPPEIALLKLTRNQSGFAAAKHSPKNGEKQNSSQKEEENPDADWDSTTEVQPWTIFFEVGNLHEGLMMPCAAIVFCKASDVFGAPPGFTHLVMYNSGREGSEWLALYDNNKSLHDSYGNASIPYTTSQDEGAQDRHDHRLYLYERKKKASEKRIVPQRL